MKNLFLGSMAIAALAMVGCSNENDLLMNENTQEVFSGEIITASSRTSIGEGGKTLWSDGDAINLFKNTGYYQKYVVAEGGNTSANFAYGNISKKGATLDQHYAVYPYAENNSINAQTKSISVDLSGLAEQTYSEGTFDPSDALMVAKSSTTALPFTNTLSMARVKISIGGSIQDATVNSVTFTSTLTALTGTATVDMTQDKPAAVITGDGKEITLAINNVALSTEATPFYVLIPANTYEAGTLKLTVNATVNGVEKTLTKEYEALNFQRSVIETFNIAITEDGDWSGSTDEDEYVVPAVITTAEQLAACLTANEKNISAKLENDIDLPIASLGAQTAGSGEYKLGGENTEAITIDLNGKKLNITTSYMSAIGANNADATITIKNGTMTSTGNSATTWNINDMTFANCNYVIENVTFNKEVALTNTGKSVTMSDVTINGTGDYYALWISAKGQTVTVDNLTVKTTGRGIKIDEQYITPAKVTLNISNSTFETNSKAAVMVKSKEGADITISNINIANVAADKVFAVWVDEDAEDYAAKVVVNGALVKVEGDNAVVGATTNEELASATIEDNATVYLKEGTYTLPNATAGKTVTIVGNEDTQISITSGLSYAVGANVTFEGVTIQSEPEGAGYTNGFADFKYAIFNKCVINGTIGLDFSCEFNECEFNIEGNYYNVWTWGAGTAKFNKCTFNCDGKALLVYANVLDNGTFHQTVNIDNCIFNDNGDDTVTGKAAVEITNTYTPIRTYDVIINETTVNGFSQTKEDNYNATWGSVEDGNLGTTLWGNKQKLSSNYLNVKVDGVDVY